MDADEASDWWEEHCSNPQHRRSHFVYLMVLALIDAFLSASYILLFPWTIFMDLFESVLLAQMWWAYVRPMLSIRQFLLDCCTLTVDLPFSHVAITASALLLLAATFERYVTISKIRSQFSRRFRLTLMLIAVSFALAHQRPDIVRNGNCTGVTMYTIMPSEWSERDPYSFVYKFCFRTIVSTFLPFFPLAPLQLPDRESAAATDGRRPFVSIRHLGAQSESV
ncbi:G-PROTEIN-RECEP-F1-2 domain-containing protein [Aphelenchoides fujianensis]|nr:G-PROTEIN-RECEP-F1-2 domain-containing protein [Aphelenchoides fujianensis]